MNCANVIYTSFNYSYTPAQIPPQYIYIIARNTSTKCIFEFTREAFRHRKVILRRIKICDKNKRELIPYIPISL